jgi:hypothetical protein
MREILTAATVVARSSHAAVLVLNSSTRQVTRRGCRSGVVDVVDGEPCSVADVVGDL